MSDTQTFYNIKLGRFINAKTSACEFFYLSKSNAVYLNCAKLLRYDQQLKLPFFDFDNKIIMKLTNEELVEIASFGNLITNKSLIPSFEQVSFVHKNSHVNFLLNKRTETGEFTGLIMYIGPTDKHVPDIFYPFKWKEVKHLSMIADEAFRICLRNNKEFYQGHVQEQS
jgi:hypothetical protein